MRVRLIASSLFVSLVALTACSPSVTPADGAVDAGADRVVADAAMDVALDVSRCSTQADCDDGTFCNGVEQCSPSAGNADARGCVAATNPCAAGETCDEAMDRCTTTGCVDADGDMHGSITCGGDDCDDTNAAVHPGATEVCDTANRDEDCDPTTFGFRDGDADNYGDARCCNANAAGTLTCGEDCNDSRPNVHPALPEACDGLDNNCDGMIDEGVQRTFLPDTDGDGFGDASGTAMTGCTPPSGYAEMPGDCDDTVASVHPGAMEQCDALMVDENCDGVANPTTICSCSGTASRPCSLSGACGSGIEQCVSGSWSACSISPVPETCNGVDDDCDGQSDEGLTVHCYPDADNDGYPSAAATGLQVCPVPGRDPVGGCPPSFTNRAPTSGSTDCNDTDSTIRPGAAELCDGAMVDENCSGTANEGCSCAAGSSRACPQPGRCASGIQICTTGTWGNCSISPTTEVCNGVDDNCDGTVDEGC